MNAAPAAGGERTFVSIDPARISGAVCVGLSRIHIDIVCGVAWHHGVEGAMRSWDLTRPEVLVACWFVGTYGVEDWSGSRVYGRSWRKRWGAWARDNHGRLWRSDYDRVPDPPMATEVAA